MPVYNSRVPGAVNWLPRAEPAVSGPVAYPAEGSPARPQGAPGSVSTLPQAGSPLMAALVKYVQSRNPAVAVNEGNVGDYTAGAFGRDPRGLGRYPWSVPGPGRELTRSLIQAGLMRAPQGAHVSSTWFTSGSPGLRARAVAGNHLRHLLGLGPVRPYVDPYAHLAMWQPSAAPAQVPVATLPEPQVPLTSGGTGVQAAPFAANTPVGPMLYPPGSTSPLFGSQDPLR